MATSDILIVEDDQDILDLLAYHFRVSGDFSITLTENGEEAMRHIKRKLPDLILLDLMLPGIDGYQLCRQLKNDPRTAATPIIMLTARGEEADRIIGLELGADDYVVKPFSPRELLLRTRAILRRAGESEREAKPPNHGWQRHGLAIDPSRHAVFVDKERVDLTATEFKLLWMLASNAGRVMTRGQLLDKVWGYRFDGYARTVDTHIHHVRHKIGAYARWIETIRGVGYRFRE
ncbi:MAG: response regulator transcription factor [Deltaproteobacteria bacterium]|nr:response regulator transcription factor [Candidatus Anaeroferrophillacea bacterium]